MEQTLKRIVRKPYAKRRKTRSTSKRRRTRRMLVSLPAGLALAIGLLLYLFEREDMPFLSGTETEKKEPILRGTISRVVDGDTVDLLDDGMQRHRIRLFGIDAPESKQAFGRQATEFLAGMVDGRRVKVVRKDKDRYGRTIGQIWLQGKDVNRVMVQKGYAWAYRYYSEDYVADENRARKHRIGLWQDKNPVEPYQFRKNRKKKK